MTASRLDQSVESVSGFKDDASGGHTEIVLMNNELMVMPVEMRIEFADNTVQTIKFPVEMWNQGSRFMYQLSDTREVRRITLDPRQVYPDDNRENNSWER